MNQQMKLQRSIYNKNFLRLYRNFEVVFIHNAYAAHAAIPEWTTGGYIQNMLLDLRPLFRKIGPERAPVRRDCRHQPPSINEALR